MTLAYDNGINLFDTAEVYAAGKYVPFLTGKSGTGQAQLPWDAPELLAPQRVCTSHSACFSKLQTAWGGGVFTGPESQNIWSLAKLPCVQAAR